MAIVTGRMEDVTVTFGPSPLLPAYRAFRLLEAMREAQLAMMRSHVPQGTAEPVKPTAKQRQALDGVPQGVQRLALLD